MVIMQIQTKDHAWQVLVKDEYLLIQKEYKQEEEQFWETELTVEVTEGNTHQLYSYLSEYIEHKDLALNLTKDIWMYGKERV